MNIKRLLILSNIIICIFVLGGCSLAYGDSLLSLPQLPGEYVKLQNRLDEITAEGLSLVVPESGENRQAVQLFDLNADGNDEAIAIFRALDGSYTIHAFERQGEDYVEVAVSEGHYGTTLHSMSYLSLGSDMGSAIALSWGFDEDTSFGMSILGLGESDFFVMLDIRYVQMGISDIDNDLSDEIAFVVKDSLSGIHTVQIYEIADSVYKLQATEQLCLDARNVTNMSFGSSLGGVPAVFIDSSATSGGYVSDVITYQNGVAQNQTIDPASGSGTDTWRTLSVLCSDINGDGIIDVPVSPDNISSQERFMLDWYNFSASAPPEKVQTTFYNTSDSWYIDWPEDWGSDVTYTRTTSSTVARVNFNVRTEQPSDGESAQTANANVLSVLVFTGDNSQQNLLLYRDAKVLTSESGLIYAYILPEHGYPQFSLSEEQIESLFSVIEQNWILGAN